MTHPILISTAAFDGYDLAVALKEIAGLGLDLVELAFIEGYTDPFTEDFFSETNAKMISDLLQEHALSCLTFSAHMDLSGDRAADIFSRRMRFARSVGASFIISNAGPRDRRTVFLKNMEALARLAEDVDIMIGLENPGDGNENILNSGEDARGVMRDIGSSRVTMNYDFGNLISHCFEKIRPEKDYHKALPFTGHFHLKDVARDESGWHFTEIGKGSIEYRAVLKELAELPESVPLSLEIPLRVSRAPDASPRRAEMPMDLNVIQRVLKGSLEFVREAL